MAYNSLVDGSSDRVPSHLSSYQEKSECLQSSASTPKNTFLNHVWDLYFYHYVPGTMADFRTIMHTFSGRQKQNLGTSRLACMGLYYAFGLRRVRTCERLRGEPWSNPRVFCTLTGGSDLCDPEPSLLFDNSWGCSRLLSVRIPHTTHIKYLGKFQPKDLTPFRCGHQAEIRRWETNQISAI